MPPCVGIDEEWEVSSPCMTRRAFQRPGSPGTPAPVEPRTQSGVRTIAASCWPSASRCVEPTRPRGGPAEAPPVRPVHVRAKSGAGRFGLLTVLILTLGVALGVGLSTAASHLQPQLAPVRAVGSP
jgi:hypothetical protein